ncbi:MAG: AraC family transcriptional regulator ligand-binding domain-containing protein [Anaeromyxobacteraceae bacterium]
MKKTRPAVGPTRPAPARGEPGICAWITRAVLLELESRGADATALLARHGLDRETLDDSDAWISQRAHAGFYRDAIVASGDPALGIGAGRRIPIHVTRAVGHAAALAGTLREAFEIWGRFSDLVAEDTRFGTRSTPAHDAVYWTRPPALPQLHDDGPSFAMAVLGFVDHVVGPHVHPAEVHLTGPAPASPYGIVEGLGAPVHWGAEHFEMRFAPGTLDLALRFADPGLRALLVEAAGREVGMRRGNAASRRVRAAILQLGFDRSGAVAAVARALGTTPRTLQRWLSDESLTFSEVREATLREAALAVLADPEVPLSDAAFRLGFSSRGGFHAAVKRWTGKTPGELRRRGP